MVLHKLYFTLLWLTALASFVVISGSATIAVHDRIVVSQDFACLDREIEIPLALQAASQRIEERRAKPSSPFSAASFEDPDFKQALNNMLAVELAFSQVEASCNIDQLRPIEKSSSTRVWNWWDENAGRRDFEGRSTQLLYSVASLIPIGALVALRRWVRWLLK